MGSDGGGRRFVAALRTGVLITQVMSSTSLRDCRACTIMLLWTHTHLSLTPYTNNNILERLR